MESAVKIKNLMIVSSAVLLLCGCQVEFLGAGDGSDPDTAIEKTGTAEYFVQSGVADLCSMRAQ